MPKINDFPPPPLGKTGWPWTEGGPEVPEVLPDGRPWPRVTIVTPSYNQGQFLEETIRSVLLQGYPNLEYIIMDGGSTDNSVEIIKKYDPWITYWESKKDRGQAHAINKGFRRATGEIIAWLNSDDTYLPGAIKEAAEYLVAHPDVAVVYGDCVFVDESGNELNLYKVTEFSLDKMLEGDIIPQPSTFIRKTVLSEIGFLNEKYSYSFDYEWFLRIALKGKIMSSPLNIFSKFRLHGNSKTCTNENLFRIEEIEILNSLPEKELRKCNLVVPLKKSLFNRYVELCSYFLNGGDFENFKIYFEDPKFRETLKSLKKKRIVYKQPLSQLYITMFLQLNVSKLKKFYYIIKAFILSPKLIAMKMRVRLSGKKGYGG